MICMYVGPNLKLSPWSNWNEVESNRHFSYQDLMLSDAIALHCLKPSRVPVVQGSPLREALIGGEEPWAHIQGPGSTARPAIHVLRQVIETLRSSVCVYNEDNNAHFICFHAVTHPHCESPLCTYYVMGLSWAPGCFEEQVTYWMWKHAGNGWAVVILTMMISFENTSFLSC